MIDVGVSALAAGCGLLQVINLAHCVQVTDAGVTALSHGCCQGVRRAFDCFLSNSLYKTDYNFHIESKRKSPKGALSLVELYSHNIVNIVHHVCSRQLKQSMEH